MMAIKRVGIICDAIDFDEKTGIGVYAYNLIHECLHNKEYDFFFIHGKKSSCIPPDKEIIIPTFFADSPFGLIFRLFRKFILIPIKLRKLNIDIVFETNAIGPYSFDLWGKYKKASMIHDLTPLLYPQYHSFLNRLAFKVFLKRSVMSSDVLFTNSIATKNDIVSYYGVPSDRIVVSYLGLSSFPKGKPVDSLTPGKFILSVSTLEPRKNLIRLLESFLLLKRQGKLKDCKLVLTGKCGWKLEDSIRDETLIEDFGSEIIRTGYVSQETLAWLYSNCDVFAYPSLYEGFGLPILEAMSHGAPVITSNISSMPEVVGDAGLLVDPFSVEDIANKVELLTTDLELKRKLGKAGIERSKAFTWNACARATFNGFKSLYGK